MSFTITHQSSLSKEQKDAVGLLSIGTFLEYFDVMIYIHMAILLNELFFPKTDPFITSLIAAFTFCSTYILRPLGALIFGYIGDKFGRKTTVLLTIFIMAGCCIIMAILPTYAEIGITASCVMILCRMVQGMAAMGESIGAEIYITETLKPPMQYPMVALLSVLAGLGGTFALAIASFIIHFEGSWRVVFWIGAFIAAIGTIARTTLREAPDFANAKRNILDLMKKMHQDPQILENNAIWKEKVSKKTTFALFVIQCVFPVSYYFVYIYCGTIMQEQFGLTSEQIIYHNFLVSIAQAVVLSVIAYLSYKIYPLKILRVNFIIIAILFLMTPYLLDHITSTWQFGIIQVLLISFSFAEFPAMPIFYKHLPIFQRFTYGCMTYALGRAVMFVVTSFGLIYLIHFFGNWGILVIMIPTLISYRFALAYFGKLEAVKMRAEKKKTSLVL